jgi:hypothetical protein
MINFWKLGARFRYDHWGCPVTVMESGSACSGVELLVNVRIDQFKRKVTINCNGELAEIDAPEVDTYPGWGESLGVNVVTDTLEGKYPFARSFRGEIVEQPRAN